MKTRQPVFAIAAAPRGGQPARMGGQRQWHYR